MKRISFLFIACLWASSLSAQSINPAVFFPWGTQSNHGYSTSNLALIQRIAKYDVLSPTSLGTDRDFACNGLNSWQCIQQYNPYFAPFWYVLYPGMIDNSYGYPWCQHHLGWMGTNHPEWIAVGRNLGGTVVAADPGETNLHDTVLDITGTSLMDDFIACETPAANMNYPAGHAINTAGLAGTFIDNAYGVFPKPPHFASANHSVTECPIVYTTSNCDSWNQFNPTYLARQLVFMNAIGAAGLKSTPNWSFGSINSNWALLDAIDNPPFAGMAECMGPCFGAFDQNGNPQGQPFASLDDSGGPTTAFSNFRAIQRTKLFFAVYAYPGCTDIHYIHWAPFDCEDGLRSAIGAFLMGYDTTSKNGILGYTVATGEAPIYFPDDYYYTNFHLGRQCDPSAPFSDTCTFAASPNPVEVNTSMTPTTGTNIWVREFTDGYVVFRSTFSGQTGITVPGGSTKRVCAKANWLTCDAATPVSSFNLARDGMVVVLKAGKSLTNSDNPVGTTETQVVFSSAPFANAANGATYSRTVTATGGSASPSYVCTLVSGALPTGVTETSECHYTGTASTNGTYTFNVRIRDTNAVGACPGIACASRDETVVISPVQQDEAGTDSFTDSSAPRCVAAYSPANWTALNGGTVADCLRTTGTLIYGDADPNFLGWLIRHSGTFSDNQYMRITFPHIVANNTEGAQLQGVACQVGAGTGSSRSAYEFVTYTVGTTQYTAIVRVPTTSGGNPTVASTTTVVWAANDLAECQTLNGTIFGLHNGQVVLSWIDPSPLTGGKPGLIGMGGDATHGTMDDAAFGSLNTPTLTSITPPTPATTGVSYTYPLTATGGTGPYTFQKTSGTYPTGITITGTNLTGTPTVVGSFVFTVTATDNVSAVSPAITFSIDVAAPPVPTLDLTTINASTTIVGRQACIQVNAVGGVQPYAWSITMGSLPAGMTLGAATGQICGTPTTLGSTPFTIKVTDTAAAMDTGDFTLTITRVGGGRSRFRLH